LFNSLQESPSAAEDEVTKLIRNYMQGMINAAQEEEDKREELIEEYVTGTAEAAAETQRETEDLVRESVMSEPGEAVDEGQQAPSSSTTFYAFLALPAVLLLLSGVMIVQHFRGRPVLFFLSAFPATAAPRYLNTSYRIAAVCWTLFWSILFLPFLIVVGQGMKATIHDATWEGLQIAFHDAAQVFGAFLSAYLQPWLAALLLSALCFIWFKLHARYSLPKHERPRLHVLYGTARLLFFGLSIFGLATSLTHLSKTVDKIVAGSLLTFPKEDRDFQETIMAAAAKAAVTDNFDSLIQDALREGDYERARAYNSVAAMLGKSQSISAQTRALYDKEASTAGTVTREGLRCGKGMFLRTSSTLTEIVCGFALDLTPAGDPLDLVKQTWNWAAGDEVDTVIVTLSTLGMVLYWWPEPTGQSLRYGAIAGKHTLKAAKSTKASSRLYRTLQRTASDAFNPSELAAAVWKGPQAFQAYVKRPAARQARAIFSDIGDMAHHGSYSTPLLALKYADDVQHLTISKRVAQVFGRHADGMMILLKSRLYKLFRYYPLARAIKLALGGWSTLLAASWAALLGSLFSLSHSRAVRFVALRSLRRLDDRRSADQVTPA
jgi:hypothetical protein